VARITVTKRYVECNRCHKEVVAPGHTKRETDRELKAKGWRIDRSEDVCPECKGQEQLGVES